MFVCVLKCLSCNYESESFVETYSIHSDAHTILCKSPTTGYLRIVRLDSSDIPDAITTDTAIENFATVDDEIVVRTCPGKKEQLDLICPSCDHRGLLKEIVGVQ